MPRFTATDGQTLDTAFQVAKWEERIDWSGKEYIGRTGKSTHRYETLFQSDDNTFTVMTRSLWRPEPIRLRILSHAEAVKWFLENDYDIPPILFIQ
jgi:hypothetical protein